MLSSLLGSEIRARIFKFFFSDPDKLFSLDEVAKATVVKAPGLQKELNLLVKHDFLKTLKEAKIKKYFANCDSIFFTEIRSIISKEKILSIKDVFSDLKKEFQPKLMFLSGKFVSKPELPTDVFFVGTVSRKGFLAAITNLEKALGYEINFTIMSEQEFDYRREVADVFLYNVLGAEKIMIAGDLN
jgi:hypothetical protein